MAEKVWLELTVHGLENGSPMGEEITRVTWQWRGGRCVKNGTTFWVEEAIADAWDAYMEYERVNGE